MTYLRFLQPYGTSFPLDEFAIRRREYIHQALNSKNNIDEYLKNSLNAAKCDLEYNLAELDYRKELKADYEHGNLDEVLNDPTIQVRISDIKLYELNVQEDYSFIAFLENEIRMRGINTDDSRIAKKTYLGNWVEPENIFNWTLTQQWLSDIIIYEQKRGNVEYSLDNSAIAQIINKIFRFKDKKKSINDISKMLNRSEKYYKNNKRLNNKIDAPEIRDFIVPFFNKFAEKDKKDKKDI